jgi:hypothetical protein
MLALIADHEQVALGLGNRVERSLDATRVGSVHGIDDRRVDDRQRIWRDAHIVSILLVQGVDAFIEVPARAMQARRPLARQLRPEGKRRDRWKTSLYTAILNAMPKMAAHVDLIATSTEDPSTEDDVLSPLYDTNIESHEASAAPQKVGPYKCHSPWRSEVNPC